ncbi:D-isomer specific 2-hydroxyacid dehydrogenase family protein [Flavobacterium sp.]|uniref:D-isomer specific 2-hydroxyacid dehydrogenase family protein n=1 Tax=Flavobacterium sp. TaxID=239 RepID=UPI002B4AD9F1|nr:D-isomer specific 2-hydroxyacid dehydrogenase family protein [Flavobacterium sp.]HLF51234.1 D-isomer specific 2-hydroxyacid dehydrogenase family protein [Flavobacterium sp.]
MKLLITESEDFSSLAISNLKEKFEVEVADINNKVLLMDKLSDVGVLFVRLRFKIDRKIIENAPQLKYILSATTGLDHVDVNYFEKRGGKIISLKGETDFLSSIPSTAEHTWALLLSLIKKIPSSFTHVKEGKWNRNLFKGNNLKGKKIGILGLGRVGKQVAQFAAIFEMEVGYFDICNIKTPHQSFQTPEELFSWADIVTIHIPYNAENENFVNKELLSHAKIHSMLINTSRGGVWDENSVAQLLKQRKIKGVAVDVLEKELDGSTISSNPLVLLAKENYNVIITPHIAGATYESMAMTEEYVADKFINLFKKDPNH